VTGKTTDTAATASALGPAPGTKIAGVFTVERVLGQGGMGIVLLAHDEVLDRDVAIKFVRKDLLHEPELRDRFLTEARAMARVRHPNVLPIYAFGVYEEAPYFVTEHVDGQTVESWLRERPAGTFPDLERALRILEDTCDGVAAIHAAQTVHRDLKPGNLLLDAEFRVRVADMGVADLLRRAGGSERREIVGTPEYMAPENVVQSEVPAELVHRADVYALGCLAFELLTGTTPFRKKGTLAGMLARLLEAVPAPSSVRPGLDPAFDEVVLHALAKDPKERTPSAEALRRALVAARDKTRDPVRILLADDDDDFRELLGATLRHEFPDATNESVREGGAALEAFDARSHSVAIVDLQMPDLDGMQLTEILRTRDAARNVPIIVITASGGPAEWRRLAALGADGFLVKPVNVKDVVTLVRRALEERSSIQPTRGSPPAPSAPSPMPPPPIVDAPDAETLVERHVRAS
jgi:serine/threonine-protein kinase